MHVCTFNQYYCPQITDDTNSIKLNVTNTIWCRTHIIHKKVNFIYEEEMGTTKKNCVQEKNYLMQQSSTFNTFIGLVVVVIVIVVVVVLQPVGFLTHIACTCLLEFTKVVSTFCAMHLLCIEWTQKEREKNIPHRCTKS